MNNLSLLFSTVITDDEPIKLLDGAVTLYKRHNSHQWQCRFKLPNGEWHAASTNTDNADLAQTQAVAIYETVKVKIGAGLGVVTKTFKVIVK